VLPVLAPVCTIPLVVYFTTAVAVRHTLTLPDALPILADSFDPNANDLVDAIVVQADGKILAGGFFTSIGGQPRNRIARLGPTTSQADSFNPNPNQSVDSIVVQAEHKTLATGGFTSINGQPSNLVARSTNVTA